MVLYKISVTEPPVIERVVITDHKEDWSIIYDIIGDNKSKTISKGKDYGYSKEDLIKAYKDNGFDTFKRLNPLRTAWEEYFYKEDKELFNYIASWIKKK